MELEFLRSSGGVRPFRSRDGTRLVLAARGLTEPSDRATVPPRALDLGDMTDDERLLPPLRATSNDDDDDDDDDVVASRRTGRTDDARGLNRGLLRPIPVLLPAEPVRGRCDGEEGGGGRLISGDLADPATAFNARKMGDCLLANEGEDGAALVRSALNDDCFEGVRGAYKHIEGRPRESESNAGCLMHEQKSRETSNVQVFTYKAHMKRYVRSKGEF